MTRYSAPEASVSIRPPAFTTASRATFSVAAQSRGMVYSVWLKTPGSAMPVGYCTGSLEKPMGVESTPAALDGLQSESCPQRVEMSMVRSMLPSP